jgi:hypothetical protein
MRRRSKGAGDIRGGNTFSGVTPVDDHRSVERAEDVARVVVAMAERIAVGERPEPVKHLPARLAGRAFADSIRRAISSPSQGRESGAWCSCLAA